MNWIQLVTNIATIALASHPKTAKVSATLVPAVVKGIVLAESMKGASGPEKLEKSIAIAREGFIGWDALQPRKINLDVSDAMLKSFHSAIVDSANVWKQAQLLDATPAPEAPAP